MPSTSSVIRAVPLMENGKPAEVHRARAPIDRTNADRPLPIDPATGAARHMARWHEAARVDDRPFGSRSGSGWRRPARARAP